MGCFSWFSLILCLVWLGCKKLVPFPRSPGSIPQYFVLDLTGSLEENCRKPPKSIYAQGTVPLSPIHTSSRFALSIETMFHSQRHSARWCP